MEISTEAQIAKIGNLLAEKQNNIVIVSHRNPDGDAMGSTCALYLTLKKMGQNVDLIIPNAYPKFLNWLPGIKDSLIFDYKKDRCINALKDCSIFFAIDFNDLSRVREFEEHIPKDNNFKVLIDHHPDPGDFADLTISDTSVSSASELTYLFIKKLKLEKYIDKDIAECIFTGIMTDTGCFSYNSSKKQTYEVVGELLEYGIEKDKIYGLVNNNFSIDRMKLMGHCLVEKMTYLPEYNTALLSLSMEDMLKFNFKVGDSEGFVNIPLSIKDVKFTVLFTEREDIVKLSLRSTGNFKVNEIASKYYNGGGHMNAAGGESKENLSKTIENFIKILSLYKEELTAE